GWGFAAVRDGGSASGGGARAVWRLSAEQWAGGLQGEVRVGLQHFVMPCFASEWGRLDRMSFWGQGVEDKRAIFDRRGGGDTGGVPRAGCVRPIQPAGRRSAGSSREPRVGRGSD